jgi:hypothetical protein
MSSTSETSEQETYEITIYKLQHRTDTTKEIYVGSTKTFKKRMNVHRDRCNNPNAYGHNYPVYVYIRENGGWNAWEVIDLATEYVENKHEQDEIENNYIKLLKPGLNACRPGEHHRQGGKLQYGRNHSSKRLKEKIQCKCGSETNKSHKSRHEKSQKHQAYINGNNNAGTINQYFNCTINFAKPEDRGPSPSL